MISLWIWENFLDENFDAIRNNNTFSTTKHAPNILYISLQQNASMGIEWDGIVKCLGMLTQLPPVNHTVTRIRLAISAAIRHGDRQLRDAIKLIVTEILKNNEEHWWWWLNWWINGWWGTSDQSSGSLRVCTKKQKKISLVNMWHFIFCMRENANKI